VIITVSAVIANRSKDTEMPPIKETEKSTQKPDETQRPTDTEKPTETETEAPTADVDLEEVGCEGVIGATAVVITAILGLGVTVLGKKH
jgi:uncharacterized protein HemX